MNYRIRRFSISRTSAALFILGAGLCQLRSEAIRLTWDASATPDIAGYRLYQGPSKDVFDTIKDVGTSTTAQVLGLSPNQTYYFTVTAYNSANLESDPSNVVAYTVPDEPVASQTQLMGLAASTEVPEDGQVTLQLHAEHSTTTTWSSGTTTTERKESLEASYTIVRQPAHGHLDPHFPTVIYRPFANYFGEDSFTYQVTDGQLTSEPTLVRIRIQPVNDAPIALSQALVTTAGSTIGFHLQGLDVEGSPLTFVRLREPRHGTITGENPSLWYTPHPGFSGIDTVEFIVSDGAAESNPATITIEVQPKPNHPPAALAQTLSVPRDGSLPVALVGSDPDNDPITFVIAKMPTHGLLSGLPPSVVYKPNPGYVGDDAFEFAVTDGQAESPRARVSITITPVNSAPVAISQSLKVVLGNSIPVILDAYDPDGDPLNYHIASPPTKGTLQGVPPQLTYTPDPGSTSLDSFAFVVTDGSLTSEAGVVNLIIQNPNGVPRAIARSSRTREDTPLTLTLAGSDPDGDPLEIIITRPPANGTLSGQAPNFTYTPSSNYHGMDSYGFVVSDGTNRSSEASVDIEVIPVNDPPVAQGQSITLNEDTPVAFSLQAWDVEGSNLVYNVTMHAGHGTLSGIAPDLVYTPAKDFHGSARLAFFVSDGAANSSYAYVNFTVVPVNDPPVAEPSTHSTAYQTRVSVPLRGYDVERSAISFSVGQHPRYGRLNGKAPNLSYQPNPGFYGADDFTFTVSDGQLTSDVAKVTIHVSGPGGEAVPKPDFLVVNSSGNAGRLTDGSNSVTANDGATAQSIARLHTAPEFGMVELQQDGTFQYRHFGGHEPFDSFSYVLVNGEAISSPTTVSINVLQTPTLVRTSEGVAFSVQVLPGVTYSIQGNDVIDGSQTGWQTLTSWSPTEVAEVLVPADAPADGTARFLRLCATDAHGTLVTEVFGFQRFPTQAGVRSYASPFHGARAALSTVAAASGSTVTLASSSLPAGAWNPAGPVPTHALIVRDTAQWWPILGNTSQTVTVDPRGSNLSAALAAGAQIEVVRLATALDILGAPGTADSAISVGDFVDFVTGNGTVATIECRTTAGVPAYHLSQSGTPLGAVNPSSITFLPGQPVQVQKAGAIGTLWFLGRVQSNPLTIDTVSANGTNGGVIE